VDEWVNLHIVAAKAHFFTIRPSEVHDRLGCGGTRHWQCAWRLPPYGAQVPACGKDASVQPEKRRDLRTHLAEDSVR